MFFKIGGLTVRNKALPAVLFKNNEYFQAFVPGILIKYIHIHEIRQKKLRLMLLAHILEEDNFPK